MYLTDLGKLQFPAGVQVDTRVVIGDPPAAIASLAVQAEATAVVMATHGRSGLARSILGSVAGGVVHRGTSPVLVVHPPKLRPAQQTAPSQAPIIATA